MQVGVKECVSLPIKPKDIDGQKLKDVLEKCNVALTENPRANFDAKDIEQDLRRLLGDKKPFNKNSELDLTAAMSACSCLIKINDLLSDSSSFGTWALSVYNLQQFMRLDAAAVQALNLLPSAKDANERHNLFGLLNKCQTAMGSRRLRQWVKQPLVDLDAINHRLDLVELFVSQADVSKEIRTRFLRNVPDLERMVKKIQQKTAALGEVASFYAFSLRVPTLLELLGTYDDNQVLSETFTKPFTDAYENLKLFQALVEETIDPDSITVRKIRRLLAFYGSACLAIDFRTVILS
jgi:DNA mismatch repair protein MSH2